MHRISTSRKNHLRATVPLFGSSDVEGVNPRHDVKLTEEARTGIPEKKPEGGKGGAPLVPKEGLENSGPLSISDLIKKRQERESIIFSPPHKKRMTQRGDLLNEFFKYLAPRWHGKTKLTKSFLGIKTSHLSLADLYYIRSICREGHRQGKSAAKIFWGSLKPRPPDNVAS